jgi:nucleotide-binding universal stress UspA family protein
MHVRRKGPTVLTDLTWDNLPAGPVSGVQSALWRTRTGTAVHGNRRCPSLSRSTPTSAVYELGVGRRLGDLAWPSGLHCDLAFDEEVERYLREARQILADRGAAIAALVAVPPEDLQNFRHDGRPRVWPWWAFAATLADSLITATSAPRPHADLAPLDAETSAAVTRAAEAITRRLASTSSARAERLDALSGLHRACGAAAILSQYDGRFPGPLWIAFQQTGWDTAAAVIRAADPNAEHHRGAHITTALNAVHTGRHIDEARYLTEIDRDVLTPLERAFLYHGQESFTHHRAWALTHEPDKGWPEVLAEWLDGSSFGWATDRSDRDALARPAVLNAAMPAIAAADAAWHALLDGLALAEQQPYLVARPVTDRASARGDWMWAASVFAYPFAQTSGATGRTRWLVQCVPQIVMATISGYESIPMPLDESLTRAELASVAAALDELPTHQDAGEIRHAIISAITCR